MGRVVPVEVIMVPLLRGFRDGAVGHARQVHIQQAMD